MCKKGIVVLCFIMPIFFLACEGYADEKGLRGFERIGPNIGMEAPDFTLKDLTGKAISLSQFRTKKPVLLVFGSYTCPVYRGKVNALEQLYQRYKERIAFLVIYTTEAHPSGSNSPYADREWVTSENKREQILFSQPQSYSEREKLAQLCAKSLQITVPLLIDEMNNGVWSAYGRAPNSAFLIDVQGRVVERQAWLNPRQMENAIISLLDQRKER